jgi:hypothetical protein
MITIPKHPQIHPLISNVQLPARAPIANSHLPIANEQLTTKIIVPHCFVFRGTNVQMIKIPRHISRPFYSQLAVVSPRPAWGCLSVVYVH